MVSLGALTSWLRPSKNVLRRSSRPAHLRHLRPGDYAGIAVYRPRDRHDLKLELFEAIGTSIALTYVGIAENYEVFAGQMLFQERQGGRLRSWLAERDLVFIELPASAQAPAPSQNAPAPSQKRLRTAAA